MNSPAASSSGKGFGQFMVDQRPVFDQAVRKKKKKWIGTGQVEGKNLIHPDKRRRAKYI